jgi:distribution and morphology protein 31
MLTRDLADRRAIRWDYDHPLDPASFRHKSRPGDFELESLQLEDVLITVYQPGNFRPYTASIFRADLRCFRKQWMFYDFLSAENVVGQFDNCLFSLHKPQSIGRTTERDLKDEKWSKMVIHLSTHRYLADLFYQQSRIRIDGVNIDHLRNSTSQEGPISWITSGKLDAVLDIKFPRDLTSDLALNALLGEIAGAISTSLERIPGQRELAKPPLTAPSEEDEEANIAREDERPRVIVDIDLRFRDLKAAVPIFTSDLSYVNNALIRPIVGFMKWAQLSLFSVLLLTHTAVLIERWYQSAVGWSKI